MSPAKAALVADIMVGYEINIAKWIAREIKYWVMSTNKVMAFPCLMTHICLDAGVQEYLNVDQFIRPGSTINLGLIRDIDYPISKVANMGATLIREVYKFREHRVDTTGFIAMGETPMEYLV